MLGIEVIPASVQDRDCAAGLIRATRRLFPWIATIFADGGYAGPKLAAAMASQPVTLEIVKRTDKDGGFKVVRRRWVNALPAMIYHGVNTEETVLMRVNSAPRSAAESLAVMYRTTLLDEAARYSVTQARSFLVAMSSADWQRARPSDAALSGEGYRRIWRGLSGEAG